MEGSNKKRQHVGCEPGGSDGDGNSGDIEISLKRRRVGNVMGTEGADSCWMAQRRQEEQDEQQLGAQDRLPSVDMDSAVDSRDLMTAISQPMDGAKEEKSGDWVMMGDENDEAKSFNSSTKRDGVGKRGIVEAARGAKKIRVHLPEGYHSSKYGIDDVGRNNATLKSVEAGQEYARAVMSKELKARGENDGFHSMALVPYAPLPIHALVQHMATEASDEVTSEQQSGPMEME
eukprot:jgi/Picsp_1/1878/NSC_05344-R1_---NA---